MKVLGVIPARGGSKRLPRKNLADLGGRPLLRWTLDVAIESGMFEEGWLWVSSEDEEIGKVAGPYWWRRDSHIAQDDTPTEAVIFDIFGHQPADIVVVLQPTSPLRTVYDIKQAFDMMIRTEADVVTSVTKAAPDTAFEFDHTGKLNLVPNIVVENGAIYLIRDYVLKRKSWWYGGNVCGYMMPQCRSIDIDTERDLEEARRLVSKNGIA